MTKSRDLDKLTACTWLSEDVDAFKCAPQARLFAKQIPAEGSATLTITGERRCGNAESALDLSREGEASIVSLLLAAGLLPWVCAQIERAGWEAAGHRPERWWKAIGLERRKHLLPIASAVPSKPGDIDLILGKWEDQAATDWLIGVEFKRIKFNADGSACRGLKSRLETSAEQAAGLRALGFHQTLVALIVSLRLEDETLLPTLREGSEARRQVHRTLMARIAKEVEARIPDPMVGVIALLWDSPPHTNPREQSDLYLYKLRRPQVNRAGCGARLRLEQAVQQQLEHMPLARGSLVTVCPTCRQAVRVSENRAMGCPECSSSWDFPRPG